MLMIEGHTFRCQNRVCSCEVIVTASSVKGTSNPRCCCGSEMKKPYVRPRLRELSRTPALAHQFTEHLNER